MPTRIISRVSLKPMFANYQTSFSPIPFCGHHGRANTQRCPYRIFDISPLFVSTDVMLGNSICAAGFAVITVDTAGC